MIAVEKIKIKPTKSEITLENGRKKQIKKTNKLKLKKQAFKNQNVKFQVLANSNKKINLM